MIELMAGPWPEQVIAQITMMVQLSNQSKQTYAARTEARELESRIEIGRAHV